MQQPQIEFYKIRDFGTKISTTIDFIKINFKGLFTVLLLVGGPLALINSLLMQNLFGAFGALSTDPTNSDFSSIGVSYIGYFLITTLGVTLIYSTIFTYVKRYNEGRLPASVGETLKEALGKFWKLLGLSILVGLLLVIGYMLFIIPGFYLTIVLSLAFPVLFFEDKSIGDALSRPFKIIKGKWWSTFGLLFITGIIAYIVGLVFSIPFYAIYITEIFANIDSIDSNPEGVFNSFSSWYMTLSMAILTIGSYMAVSIPVIALAYQYSNLTERTQATGLINKIDEFDTL